MQVSLCSGRPGLPAQEAENWCVDEKLMALMTREQRAAQIWAVLAWAAEHRQSMTYGMLAKLTGVPAAALGKLLEPIQSYCIIERLPPLTILVVRQETGLPG